MTVKHFEPIEPLKNIIDYIWIVKENHLAEENREDTIMPLGHMNIIFNYGSDYFWIKGDQEVPVPNAVVIGQIKAAKHIRYGRKLEQIGISMKPVAFMHLFRTVCSELTEQVLEANQIEESLIDLYKDLQNLNEMEEKIQTINKYLLKKVEIYLEDTALIDEMIGYIKEEYNTLNINEMGNYFHMSVSSLERYFKKNIGLTPKAFGDIMKFHKNIADTELRKQIDRFYYDQSHLIRKSKKFTGKTIGELEKASNELTLHYIFHEGKMEE